MAALSRPMAISLSRDRQIITRLQELRIARTFPFLSLPPEIRNIIYELCLSDLHGIEAYFDKYYARLKKSRNPSKTSPPKPNLKTPTVFLIHPQITSEVDSLLPKMEVNFHHGLLDLKSLTQVVSKNVLCSVGTITISTKGHPLLQKNLLSTSWLGFTSLLSELIETLSTHRHRLKNLNIAFDDDELDIHTTECWEADIRCDFRDGIKDASKNLRKIRGVGNVNITGIPTTLAQDIKMQMQAKPLSFLDLPGELRNTIYELAADRSDITVQLERTMAVWTDRSKPPPYPERSTPSILLINRDISNEASQIINSKPLNLVLPYDHDMQKQAEVPNVLRFITKETLQKVEHLRIEVDSWEWIYSLDSMLPALVNNHSLKTLHFSFKDSLKGQFLQAQDKKYPDNTLQLGLSGLAGLRGIEKVTIEGDLPEVYTTPLMELMQSAAGRTTGLPTLKAVRGNGSIVDADGAED